MARRDLGFVGSLVGTHVLAGCVAFVTFGVLYLYEPLPSSLLLTCGGLVLAAVALNELRHDPMRPLRVVYVGSALVVALVPVVGTEISLAFGAALVFYAAVGVVLIDRPSHLTAFLVVLAGVGLAAPVRAIAETFFEAGVASTAQLTEALLLSSAGILQSLVLVASVIVFRRLRKVVLRRDEVIRAKDDLIDTISHELRTPLTTVVGYSQILLESSTGDLPDHVDEQVQLIADGARVMEEVIDDFRVAARTEAGGIATRMAQIQLRPEVDRVISGVVANGRDISVELDDVCVWADDRYLRQVLRNLITNAVEHGGQTVRVTASDHEGRVRIAVWDNGNGVPATEVSQLFQPYWIQIHTGQPGRKGLGLWVSKVIARQMDGDVTYRRTRDGTTFELDLRSASHDEAVSAPSTASLATSARRRLFD